MLFSGRSPRVVDVHKDTQFTDAWIVLAVRARHPGTILDNRFLTAVAALSLLAAGVAWLWAHFSLHGVTYERRFGEQQSLPW